MAAARPAAIIAAILLPPLGVFLARGLGPSFWIAALLTCMGFVPGVAYALFTLLRPEASKRAES
jgi:uncharacterized membrane protein YqaE (UPF0057 family)